MPNPFPGSSALSLYRALIEPLRRADQDLGAKLLERFLVGPQTIHNRTEADIQTLLDQVVPTKVRSDLLKWLKDIVGFTVELRGITDRLTEAQLRKLIGLAVPLWNQRETEQGIVNVVRLLTGRIANLTNWFGFRFILGESFIGEDQKTSGGDSWIVGGAISLYDEFFTNIRIMDDGTLDELLLIDLIRLERALSERVEIFLADFLDKFGQDLSRWTFSGSGTASIVNGELLLPGNHTAVPTVPILPANPTGTGSTAWANYVVITKFRLNAAGSKLRVLFYNRSPDVLNYYQLTIQLSPSPKVELQRFIGGVGVVIDSSDVPLVGLAVNTFYKLRIQIQSSNPGNPANVNKLRVYIDNILAIPSISPPEDFTDSGIAGEPSRGDYRFLTITADTVTLDNVESWRFVPTARFALVETSTLDQRGGKVTMTANFVQ